MFNINDFELLTTEDRYETMVLALKGLVKGNENDITKISNASALIYSLLENVNWCGFYINNNELLELGPFQGRPVCAKIKFGKGVCGKCAISKEIIIVDNINTFEGYILCDISTKSEISMPVIKNNKLYAVLGIGSKEICRFRELEIIYLKKAMHELVENVNWERICDIYK